MAEFPALPLWTDAYLGDTTHLTLEQHGAYLKLLIIAWRTGDCAIPDDDAKIARMLGVTVARWLTKLRPEIEPFWTVAEGRWTQKRLLKEREKVQNFSEVQRERSKKRWNAKSLNGHDPGDAGAKPARGNPNPTPTPYPDKKETLPAAAGDPPPRAHTREEAAAADPASLPIEAEFVALAEAHGDDPRKTGGMLAAWKAEFSGAGYAATLRAVLARARSNPVALAELKFGDLRKDRHRGEAEARQQQSSEWSADALIAAAARRQMAEAGRDAEDGWPVVTECPRLGGPE